MNFFPTLFYFRIAIDTNPQLSEDLGLFAFPTFYYGKPDNFRDIRAIIHQAKSMIFGQCPRQIVWLIFFPKDLESNPRLRQTMTRIMIPNQQKTMSMKPTRRYHHCSGSDIEKSTSDSLTQALVSTHLIA